MKTHSKIIVFVGLMFGTVLLTQAQMQMPKPAPELKKLDYFLGSWAMSGDTKTGPMGPGGPWTGSEKNEWMDGSFFLIGHDEFKTPMGEAKGASFLGYNSDEKVYTYDAFNSMGESDHAKGTVDGDNWTWTSEQKMGGQMIKSRYTIKVTSPTTYDVKYEMSQDGTNWTTIMEGKAKKK
jgi:hypothetical protein